jgi:hypothetical protein
VYPGAARHLRIRPFEVQHLAVLGSS